MRILILLCLFITTSLHFSFSQREITNVIILIPDGTSSDILALARWYKGAPLAIDALLCGMVKTHSADSTIADSAPASTAYSTGYKSLSGYVGVDANKNPHISLLEMAKLKGLSTGIVATSEFMHATPADFVCHNPSRKGIKVLMQQFLYNSPDVVFTGGKKYLDSLINGVPVNQILTNEMNFTIVTSKKDFDACSAQKVWGIFNDWNDKGDCLSYDIDRNPATEPSLAEMSEKAINLLSKNNKGFFLMIEGSQIDWAAHLNDPVATITDFLAFDKAVEVSLNFAKQNDNTLIIVCPDHGNGGISIGNRFSNTNSAKPLKIKYDKLNIHNHVITPLRKAKISARNLTKQLINTQISNPITYIDNMYGLKLSITDSIDLYNIINNKTISRSKRSDSLQNFLGTKLSNSVFIGWTTSGHTGEDVFLGVYTPDNQKFTGVVDNTEIFKYISEELKFEDSKQLDLRYMKVINPDFMFKNFKIFNNKSNEKSLPKYSVTYKYKKEEITLIPNVNYYLHNGKKILTKTLIIFINKSYYVPEEVYNLLDK